MPVPLKRRRPVGERYGAGSLELFFDLVFVFAVTQVSHLLLDDLTWRGAARAGLALLVVWWAWQYTTWVTNELDPEANALRVLLIALMLCSLLLAIAIPRAFGDRALLFAGSYVAIQVGRHAFLTFGAAEPGSIERRRAGRILTWFCAAGVLWIAGALAGGSARTVLWVAALAIDYGGPLCTFWLPGVRRVSAEDWAIGTGHFTERFGLFVIIALGESIVLIGSTTASGDLGAARLGALVCAFLLTACLWWLYFTAVSSNTEHALEHAENRTLLARDVYTYGHALVIGGVILAAVGAEIVIAHPSDHLPRAELLAVVAGPALYLLSQLLLRLRVTGALSRRRLGGLAGCVAVGLAASGLPALAVEALLVAVLLAVLVADQVVIGRRREA